MANAEPMQKPRSANVTMNLFMRPVLSNGSPNLNLCAQASARTCSPDRVLEFAQPIEDVGERPIRQRARESADAVAVTSVLMDGGQSVNPTFVKRTRCRLLSILPSLLVASLIASFDLVSAQDARLTVPGITNFARVNKCLYRGAQPNGDGIKSLARLGVKTIINLRMTNDVWLAEKAEARAMGITYTNVPMSGIGRPTDEQVAKVLLIIETGTDPVFVHCQHGPDRTGTIIACYRIRHDKWPSKQALQEANEYGMSPLEIGMKHYVGDFGKSHKSD